MADDQRELNSVDDDLRECPRCGDFLSIALFDEVITPDGDMWFVCENCTDSVEAEGIDG